jgi:hypothetical protein
MRPKLAALAVLVLVLAAAPALARSSHAAPRTLYAPGDFVVRPPFMVFALGRVGGDAMDYFYGPGLTGP